MLTRKLIGIRLWQQRLLTVLFALALMLTAIPVDATRALVWEPPQVVAGPSAWANPGSLVTFGVDGTMAAYTELDAEGTARAYLRRTVGGGATIIPLFGSAAADTDNASLARHGDQIDVVWTRTGGRGATIRHMRSLDAGLSWSPGQPLTPDSRGVTLSAARVARDGVGTVAVVWANWRSDRLRIRVSRDGGLTFAPAMTLAQDYAGAPDVAIGGGAIVVAYRRPGAGTCPCDLVVRRSTDKGGSWSPPQILDANLRLEPEMDAAGERIMIAYDRKPPHRCHELTVQRSADAGGSWKVTQVGPGNCYSSAGVAIDEHDGVWRTLYARCRSGRCLGTRIYYARSVSDGAGWTWSDDPITELPTYNRPAGVSATSDGPLALWTSSGDAGSSVLMRRATP